MRHWLSSRCRNKKESPGNVNHNYGVLVFSRKVFTTLLNCFGYWYINPCPPPLIWTNQDPGISSAILREFVAGVAASSVPTMTSVGYMGYTMKIKEVSLTTFIEDQEQLQKWKFVPVLKYYRRSELILMYLYYRDAVLSNRKFFVKTRKTTTISGLSKRGELYKCGACISGYS